MLKAKFGDGQTKVCIRERVAVAAAAVAAVIVVFVVVVVVDIVGCASGVAFNKIVRTASARTHTRARARPNAS